MPSQPTQDDRDDLLLSCRYGDLDDIQTYVARFSKDALDGVHDDNGNNILHMAAANGHMGTITLTALARCSVDVLTYLLPLLPPSASTHQNNAGSTPLHWAVVNRHLSATQALVQFPGGPGVDLIDIKNDAGRSALGEAEMAGWDEGARWLVQVMKLDLGGKEQEQEQEQETSVDPEQAIEVEIQDADGEVARMTLHPKPS